ncbi:hypothetical protein [Paenibacillus terrigena]|uniref:hypothetical protein n=1 Tax=Paenibacillus terrigena TaxID=369333 RepID=UPI0028D54E1B|nr:hypothetical protein [Paenibacillus terrigena]
MRFIDFVKEVLPRKFIAASISCSLFGIVLALLNPNPFGTSTEVWYIELFSGIVPIYMIYSFPVIATYGVATSFFSDYFTTVMLRERSRILEFVVSACLHIVFGFVLAWISLISAVLFFLTDRVLSLFRRTSFLWYHAIFSLLIPLAIWLGFMSIVWYRG